MRSGAQIRCGIVALIPAALQGLGRAVLPVIAALAFLAPARAQQTLDPKALLDQLNNATIDPAEIYAIRNVRITRDRVNIYLNRGFIGFISPAGGEITGAVFVGDGEILMMPRDPIERASLHRFTQAAILDERFSSVYLRFTDQTARELMAGARRPEPDDPDQPGDLAGHWEPIIRKLNPEYSMRVLLDLTGERGQPCFLAYIQGSNLGAFQVEVDERVPEAIRVGAIRHAGDRAFADFWCAFPSARGESRYNSLMLGSFQVHAFRIDTRINPDNSLEASAELTLESLLNQDRIVPLNLSRSLKVTDVRDGEGNPLTLFQNSGEEPSETMRRSADWIAVVLPKPYRRGERFKLKFSYQGSVITDAGNGVLHVGERGNWYPNRGLATRADFDLTFHYPERLTLVATGNRVEETIEDGSKHSRWVSAGPQPVAGFNLGEYRSQQRRAGEFTLEVFATREVETDMENRDASRLPMAETPEPGFSEPGARGTQLPRAPAALSPASKLDNVADIAAETVTHYRELFGPLAIRHLAVTQVPGHFGQGWPGLVYLPTMAFLPRAERLRRAPGSRPEEFTNELILAHEVAHQWWGNEIGWLTYRDQWLSEGFASYSAALQMAAGKDGDRKLRELLRQYKADLLSKTPQGATVESGGPIFLGQRLSNSLNPDGYASIIYKKSCWVIHMLRELTTSGAPANDERFFIMLRDFIAAHRGRHASTRDFIRHAEKYMTPAMDLERDRRLDWFFNDWVFGTGIPEYKLDARVERTAARKFVVTGNIEQSGVPAQFEMPVPLVAHYSRGTSKRLGWVVVGEQGGEFRFTTTEKPERVAIDEDSILAVVN